jgi:pantothenate kinase-related protein Tda10
MTDMPVLVGIVGGSGSGKTLVVPELVRRLQRPGLASWTALGVLPRYICSRMRSQEGSARV